MTDQAVVVVVMLRQPKNARDQRTDPFYEFGSFGLTGCHEALVKSLPSRRVRLAFAQGGTGAVRLVYLSPIVEVVCHRNGNEVRWKPAEMPLAFSEAPFLVANADTTATTALARAVADVKCKSWASKFASKFRSRQEPLAPDLARELIELWEQVSGKPRARTYDEALPRKLTHPDRDRRATYHRLRKEAGADATGRGGCHAQSKPVEAAGPRRVLKRSC